MKRWVRWLTALGLFRDHSADEFIVDAGVVVGNQDS
jgi:hypothetical protein